MAGIIQNKNTYRGSSIIFFFSVILFFAVAPYVSTSVVQARENVNYWYIMDFDSEIVVNKDSSLDITEKITADCGNATGKHGIFRILPERINLPDGTIKTPVELLSITDFDGRPIKYDESRNFSDHTVTWKIGDPDRTVQGVNHYKIRYRVQNAIRAQKDFDEFYWNLNGNFWDIDTDKYDARIIFPAEITKNNSQVDYYTGFSGMVGKDKATYRWAAPNILEFQSSGTLARGEGITASVSFPKNIISPYVPGFWERYGIFFGLSIPIIIFIICFYLWWKYGKDPKINRPIIAEYDVPGKLTPLEMGMLMKNGGMKNESITAEFINLAVKGYLGIKEIDEKILIFHSKDYELKKIKGVDEGILTPAEKRILGKIFQDGDQVKLSDIKTTFYQSVSSIKDDTTNMLKSKNLIVMSEMTMKIVFIIIGFLLGMLSFAFIDAMPMIWIGLLLSAPIVIIFGFVMPKRTPEGAELNRQVKGFKLFMETVDKDRAKFYEEQNIFEKFLPYAVLFGITGLWIKKMKELYGDQYFTAHPLLWYSGSGAFNADSFSSTMDNLSSNIASSTASSSGSGGGGFSGGGGGGGGGGGW